MRFLCCSHSLLVAMVLACNVLVAGEHQDVIDAVTGRHTANSGAAPHPEGVINHGVFDARADVDTSDFSDPGSKELGGDWLESRFRGDSGVSDLADEILSGSEHGLQDLTAMRNQANEAYAEALQDKLFVFISLSMPDYTLRPLFEQARDRNDVVFYLRGWEPPKLLDVVRRVHEIAGASDYPVPVLVDPYAFQAYDVQHVPVFVRESDAGLRRVDGEISIPGVIDLMDSEDPLPEYPVGGTHPIEEPDPIEYARAKAATIDWDQKIQDAKQRYQSQVMGVALPQAERDESYYVDLTVRITEDIKGPGGVIAKAGAQVNPLAHVLVRSGYVFFDPSSERQLEVVREWLSVHHNLVLIATQIAPLSEERADLITALGQPVYPLNETLANRFQIERVPALVIADGQFLRVAVRGIAKTKGDQR